MERDTSEDTKRVIAELQRWLMEARDFRNDGWVQQGFKDKLMAVHAVSTAAMQTLGLTTDTSEEKNN